jgi:hypothetical protein
MYTDVACGRRSSSCLGPRERIGMKCGRCRACMRKRCWGNGRWVRWVYIPSSIAVSSIRIFRTDRRRSMLHSRTSFTSQLETSVIMTNERWSLAYLIYLLLIKIIENHICSPRIWPKEHNSHSDRCIHPHQICCRQLAITFP